jgi:hypothetical protein
MFPSPSRVAARYTKRGGVIQAPPAMVKAISAWVMSSVAATQLVSTEAEIKTDRDRVRKRAAIKPAIREVRNAISNGVKVRALYNMVVGDGGLWDKASSHRWYDQTVGYRPKFGYFAKQYKAGNQWLNSALDSMADFAAGRDSDTKHSMKRLESRKARLKGYLVRGGKTPIKAGGKTKVFPVSKYMKGWRYKDILQDPSRLAHSASLQLIKSYRWEVEDIKSDFKNALAKRPEKEAMLRRRLKRDLKEALEDHQEAVEKLKAEGKEMAFDDVTVLLTLDRSATAVASWNRFDRLVTIHYPHRTESIGSINRQMENLATSVRHELQHMAQTLLRESLDVMSAGLPGGGARTPDFKQWMKNPEEWFGAAPPSYREERGRAMQMLRDEGAIDPTIRGQRLRTKPQKVDFHALDDIEFFTRLQDSIDEAKGAVSGLSGEVRDNAIDIWTGVIKRPETYDYRDTGEWAAAYDALGGYKALGDIALDPFFGTLRKVPSAKRKYTRALKELRKALGYRR